ncbi:hypothetical protein GP475_10520 [Corynebacterium poyangense]|uniref:Uncharacterized protein n=1 Tax=Corynebacterium poyangense TaxID=2684405 RepID=A0A7H0SR37_9CORY|nr:hypothetical protein [Corynebacterium poyangense]MBZ8176438.1 hypothetical protein [Corynebacterium poyangense]QNQ91012.1 hypothetical protein GP475_10520 [Corynebacterium poyangense]
MSNHPPRRLPHKIYVRRRVAAVVIILVVVALLIWGLLSLTGGNQEDNSTPAAVSTTSDTTTPPSSSSSSSSPTSSSASSSSTSSASSSTANPNAKNTCSLKDLIITARSDRPNYGPQDSPVFYMSVENPTTANCEIDLDAQKLRFEVYAMSDNHRIWSDADCSDSQATGRRIFEAGKTTNFEAQWARTTSAPGNCQTRDPVAPGGYFVHGVIGDNPSESYTFNLS